MKNYFLQLFCLPITLTESFAYLYYYSNLSAHLLTTFKAFLIAKCVKTHHWLNMRLSYQIYWGTPQSPGNCGHWPHTVHESLFDLKEQSAVWWCPNSISKSHLVKRDPSTFFPRLNQGLILELLYKIVLSDLSKISWGSLCKLVMQCSNAALHIAVCHWSASYLDDSNGATSNYPAFLLRFLKPTGSKPKQYVNPVQYSSNKSALMSNSPFIFLECVFLLLEDDVTCPIRGMYLSII